MQIVQLTTNLLDESLLLVKYLSRCYFTYFFFYCCVPIFFSVCVCVPFTRSSCCKQTLLIQLGLHKSSYLFWSRFDCYQQTHTIHLIYLALLSVVFVFVIFVCEPNASKLASKTPQKISTKRPRTTGSVHKI